LGIKLSICIPTYNRLAELKANLALLIPQVAAQPTGTVEIVIVNNASTDGTAEFIDALPGEYAFVRVFHNPTNLGIDGNTAKCIEHAAGEYTALLSDDDFYLEGQVAEILSVVSKRDYCLIRLNFHNYLEDVHTPYQTFASEKDVFIPNAASMLTFFHGGHFSGVIYRSELAKQALGKMLTLHPLAQTGRSFGVYGEVETRIITTSSLPAYFVGKRRLATTIPPTLDYAGIEHICYDYLQSSERMLRDGVIPAQEFERRRRETNGRLPQMIVTFAPRMTAQDIDRATAGLNVYLRDELRYRFVSMPLLYIGRFRVGKGVYTLTHKIARWFKRTILYRSKVLVLR
jgi:glycosyltransferase involved in cell wall biosynthesis